MTRGIRMGMFQVKVGVRNKVDPGRRFEETFWVDTGALYTYVPEELLRRIGIEAEGTREFVLADGRKDVRRIGEAVLQIAGRQEERTCVVVFAPSDSLLLLGATALENFGLGADPVNRKLKPIIAVIGGHLTSHIEATP